MQHVERGVLQAGHVWGQVLIPSPHIISFRIGPVKDDSSWSPLFGAQCQKLPRPIGSSSNAGVRNAHAQDEEVSPGLISMYNAVFL